MWVKAFQEYKFTYQTLKGVSPVGHFYSEALLVTEVDIKHEVWEEEGHMDTQAWLVETPLESPPSAVDVKKENSAIIS